MEKNKYPIHSITRASISFYWDKLVALSNGRKISSSKDDHIRNHATNPDAIQKYIIPARMSSNSPSNDSASIDFTSDSVVDCSDDEIPELRMPRSSDDNTSDNTSDNEKDKDVSSTTETESQKKCIPYNPKNFYGQIAGSDIVMGSRVGSHVDRKQREIMSSKFSMKRKSFLKKPKAFSLKHTPNQERFIDINRSWRIETPALTTQ